MFFKKKSDNIPEAARIALSRMVLPGIGKDPISLGILKQLHVSGNKVKIELAFPDPAYPAVEEVKELCRRAIAEVPGVEFVHVAAETREPSPSAAQHPREAASGASRLSLPGVKHVIAVASGKGGVGKSTVAINLAVSLAEAGKRVGVLDADIYGPSLPMMMGIKQRPENAGGKLLPLENHGVKLMSMGFVVPDDQPVVWRGPMVHGALTQFLTQVDWGNLDYLVIDMPPGTGDAQLTISQSAPLTGAIVVTTPQEISLLDARKGLKMFESVGVPVLGIVENMAGFLAPDGSRHDIFGSGGGARLAGEANVPLLGSIPLDPAVAEGGDSGVPVVLRKPDGPIARMYSEIADRVRAASEVDSGFRSLRMEW